MKQMQKAANNQLNKNKDPKKQEISCNIDIDIHREMIDQDKLTIKQWQKLYIFFE